MDIGTAASDARISSTTSHAQLPSPTQQRAAHPPGIGIRMPQAGALSMLPASGADVLALCATPPQLQPATGLLNLPNELLRLVASLLRTANTKPAIANIARFRAACTDLYLGITAPIPDGMMGLIEFNRLEELKQMLVEQRYHASAYSGGRQGRSCQFPRRNRPDAFRTQRPHRHRASTATGWCHG